jgi:hypothetical protein
MSRCDNAEAIRLFAESCEALNDFERVLRNNSAFSNVRSSADIRNYASGWRLEKYVEAEISATRGLWAAWCLELGQTDDCHWLVESGVNISHSGVNIGFPDYVAKNTQELRAALNQAVDALIASAEKRHKFSREIERLRSDFN